MKFSQPTASLFVPDDVPTAKALARTTHMGIGAHQDDLEFMAMHPILECFQNEQQWFCGVTVTNGSGSARANQYARYSDEEMQGVRLKEQNKAAVLGEYGAMASLAYPSAAIKKPGCRELVADLKALLSATKPRFVFTHNPADKHDTHLAVTMAVIQAVRELPEAGRPKALYGCEVWRNLDWLLDTDKTVFNVSGRENVMAALMGVFDSQISGGKRYDVATLGRKRANATYFESHAVDQALALEFAMDLTPLIRDVSLDVFSHVRGFIRRFEADIESRIRKFTPPSS